MQRRRRRPPRDEHELRVRAFGLIGWTLDEVARALGEVAQGGGAHTKGKVGDLLERALGASPTPGASHDFPHLGVELKTVPVDQRGVPHESTFVCAVSVADADLAAGMLDPDKPENAREYVAARRASDPEFDAAWRRIHKETK